ncbi:hypothetical protein R3P38DRAFT_3184234 [Favolaschia claudopus]|uniref:Uncharacterized protein n=1 Tax=Favolaschia claudopus TaxID=2862362 RepID=A0AAW0C8R0_9AGAR
MFDLHSVAAFKADGAALPLAALAGARRRGDSQALTESHGLNHFIHVNVDVHAAALIAYLVYLIVYLPYSLYLTPDYMTFALAVASDLAHALGALFEPTRTFRSFRAPALGWFVNVHLELLGFE